MKKTILSFILLLLFGGGMAGAQDTLLSATPKSNCFYNYWPDSGGYAAVSYLAQSYEGLWTAVWFNTPDTLQVYGIAAALDVLFYNVHDSSTEESYEFVGLYRPGSEGFSPIAPPLCASPAHDPVAYYFDLDMPFVGILNPPSVPYHKPDPVPVYEYYYKDPIAVKDSFYVGITQRTWACDTILSYPDSLPMLSGTTYHPKVRIWSYGIKDSLSDARIVYKLSNTATGVVTYYYNDNTHPNLPQLWNPYFFPILTPQDTSTYNPVDTTVVDTTVVDTTHTDTVGISVRLLERYVNLLPNPASERVQAVSSFGLQQIEVYNAAGAKVQEQHATGYSAELDVSALPAGPYLVRIATPAGTVTKKLVVQRR